MKNRLLATLVVALAVSACSGEKAGGDALATVKAPAAAGADAAAAVLQSGGTPVAKLGFVLVTMPVVGAQSDLRLDLSATAAVPALQVNTEAETITIDPATAKAGVSLEAGKTLSHVVRITPQREGLTRVTVRLRSAVDNNETVYDIPVLVAAATGG
jgi:hypothetical protein